MEKTAIQSNRLIAEFMGSTVNHTKRRDDAPAGLWYDGVGDFPHVMHESSFYYHTSWDWLMPVIDKICQHKFEDGETVFPRTFGMPFELNGETTAYMVRFDRFTVHHGATWIEAAYMAVIEFIEWYNEQPKAA